MLIDWISSFRNFFRKTIHLESNPYERTNCVILFHWEKQPTQKHFPPQSATKNPSLKKKSDKIYLDVPGGS